jgi:rare lipoprotein A
LPIASTRNKFRHRHGFETLIALCGDLRAAGRAATGSLLVAAALGGCTELQLANHIGKQMSRPAGETCCMKQRGGVYKVGEPYQVAGVWYYPKEDPAYDQTGVASWYGEPFHGRATANGETYDMNDLTAAHQILPLPSLARVTNLQNGRSIMVRINDRGPFVNGRIIDMSRRSAQLLGMENQGTAMVRVQYVAAAEMTRDVNEPKPQVVAAPRAVVTAEPLPPPPGTPGEATILASPDPGAAPRPLGALASANRDELAQLLAEIDRQEVKVVPPKATNLFIQAGSFTRYDNAHRLGARLSGLGATRINQVAVNGVDYFRVRLGPLPTVDIADQTLNAMIATGLTEARIVVE